MATRKPIAKKAPAKKPVKRVAKKAAPLFKIIRVPDWSRILVGSKFTGTIWGKGIAGRIQKEEETIYLCTNNENAGGSQCDDMMGFKYSYCLGQGTKEEMAGEGVEILTITLDPTFKPAPTIAGRAVIFKKGYIEVGCTTVSNKQVREIVKLLQD